MERGNLVIEVLWNINKGGGSNKEMAHNTERQLK